MILIDHNLFQYSLPRNTHFLKLNLSIRQLYPAAQYHVKSICYCFSFVNCLSSIFLDNFTHFQKASDNNTVHLHEERVVFLQKLNHLLECFLITLFNFQRDAWQDFWNLLWHLIWLEEFYQCFLVLFWDYLYFPSNLRGIVSTFWGILIILCSDTKMFWL